jgi:hypothetical protein
LAGSVPLDLSRKQIHGFSLSERAVDLLFRQIPGL